jgi:hypothetical protein
MVILPNPMNMPVSIEKMTRSSKMETMDTIMDDHQSIWILNQASEN